MDHNLSWKLEKENFSSVFPESKYLLSFAGVSFATFPIKMSRRQSYEIILHRQLVLLKIA